MSKIPVVKSLLKKNATDLLGYIAESKAMVRSFAYYMNNEWIFDNATCDVLLRKV